MQKQGVYAILDDNIFKKSFGTMFYLSSYRRRMEVYHEEDFKP